MSDSTPKTVTIQLTKGYVAIVDECDGDLAQCRWYTETSHSSCVYARRSFWIKEKKSARHEFLHRAIMQKVLGRTLVKGEMVDHKNGNTLDNRRSNLRIATRHENLQNQRRHADNKSGFKGVTYRADENKWEAAIKAGGVNIYLGQFTSPEEAHKAYNEAAEKFFGEFARLE